MFPLKNVALKGFEKEQSFSQDLALVFQSTWQIRQPYATIYLTFVIFNWQKGRIYA